MKIISLNHEQKASFGAIYVPKERVRSKILQSLNKKSLGSLKIDLVEQQQNPVNAIIDKGIFGLKASFFCQYRLKNFKEDSMQYLFESNEKFLKRIIAKCNEYKKQIDI